MDKNFFALISRMRYIGRWGLMRSTVPENVQEHSHMVAVLAHALALIRRDILGMPCDPGEAAALALYHDAPEILTGDLPTPIKYHNGEIMAAYHQVEDIAAEKLLNMLPAELKQSYAPFLCPEVGNSLLPLVKAADKLSAYIKCIEERKAGNFEFLSAEKQSREKLLASPLPEVRYFMEQFIPAFELTLDELGTIDK
jgi:5'-deoxynucleotidase